jgi:hypothetical protein
MLECLDSSLPFIEITFQKSREKFFYGERVGMGWNVVIPQETIDASL